MHALKLSLVRFLLLLLDVGRLRLAAEPGTHRSRHTLALVKVPGGDAHYERFTDFNDVFTAFNRVVVEVRRRTHRQTATWMATKKRHHFDPTLWCGVHAVRFASLVRVDSASALASG